MTQLVVVTGPDGAGKSSVCQILHARLENSAVIDLWGGLSGSPFEASKAQIHEYMKSIDPISRSLLISACLSRSLQNAFSTQPSFVIADGYWYKYAVTELALSGDSTLLNIASEVFAKPNHCFFLDVQPGEALLRKSEVSHYEAGFSDDSKAKGFINFQSRIYDKWQTMRFHHPHWHTFDTSILRADAIAQNIVHILRNA